jgi:hypothetical protein
MGSNNETESQLNRMDRTIVSIGNIKKLEREDRIYWESADVKEKFETITFLRECFYGEEATTGRLQRFYKVFKR